MGTVIANVFAEQWMFMVIAVLAVAATFLVKKLVPDFYQNFLKGGLVVLVLLLVVLALLVHAPDLFLLIPIIIMCCELFGYGVTGKVVAVLFVDFMLIQLDYKLIPNEAAMTVIFYILQVVAAICIGIIMDKYIRKLQSKKREGKELTEEEIEKLEKEDNTADAFTSVVSDDNTDEESVIDAEDIEYVSDDDLDSQIDKIMSNVGIDE